MKKEKEESPEPPDTKVICKKCKNELSDDELHQNLMVCPHCNRHFHMTARDRVECLVDRKSFREWFKDMTSVDPLHFVDRVSYKERLQEAYKKDRAQGSGNCWKRPDRGEACRVLLPGL